MASRDDAHLLIDCIATVNRRRPPVNLRGEMIYAPLDPDFWQQVLNNYETVRPMELHDRLSAHDERLTTQAIRAAADEEKFDALTKKIQIALGTFAALVFAVGIVLSGNMDIELQMIGSEMTLSAVQIVVGYGIWYLICRFTGWIKSVERPHQYAAGWAARIYGVICLIAGAIGFMVGWAGA